MRQLTSLYKALADETRLRILSLLRRQELCVCDLVAALGLTQSRVSRHLAYLKNSGWVTDRRQGLWMFYSLAAPVNAVQRKLAESVVHLSKSLPACRQDAERLKRLLAQGACVASLKGRKKIAGRRRKRTS
jgi:ArsR family transcriptional regulator